MQFMPPSYIESYFLMKDHEVSEKNNVSSLITKIDNQTY